jgi:hypothetical protein
MQNKKGFNLFSFSDLKFMCRRFRTLCSIFISRVTKKNNLDQIPRVFLQVKVRFKRSLPQLEGGGSMSEWRNKLWRAPVSSGDLQ